ncbi:MAG: tetratricopeptide repeat protein [Candidatus Thioglobus sp.]|nr:MAG: tetratricopeptide repeat protein [Candidatus Thioglobus sp.]
MNNKNTEKLRIEAREKHISGKTKEAIMLLTQAICADPSATLVALDMAQIFLDIGEFEQAQNLFNKLPESAQKSATGVSISSQLSFVKLAQNTAGTDILQVQVAKNPTDYQAHFDLAICFFAQHDIEKGMQNLFFIQTNKADFKQGAAKEMIVLACNMLAVNNKEASKKYRHQLANLVSE